MAGGVSPARAGADFLKKLFWSQKRPAFPRKPAVAFWLCCGGYSYRHVQSRTPIILCSKALPARPAMNAARINKHTPNRQHEKIKTVQMYELRRSMDNQHRTTDN